MTKSEARILAKRYLANYDKTMHKIKSLIIVKKIEKDIRYKTAKMIGVFSPFNNEVDIKDLKHKYASFCYPVIKDDKMSFIKVNEKTKWQKSKFGIYEPKNGKIVNDRVDLLIISSLARNTSNCRLGYGKGYYDKFIKEYNPKFKIGVLFDNYTLDFECSDHDMALDDYISN